MSEKTVINFDSEDDLPKERLRGSAKAPMPSAEDLAFWEQKAGLTSVEKADKPEWFVTQATGATDENGVAKSSFENRDADEAKIDETKLARTSLQALGTTRKRPKTPLGKQVHRMIYAQHAQAKDPSSSIEQHASDWDAMSDAEKHDWQQGEGKEATAQAIANRTFHEDTVYKRAQRRRDTVRSLTFETPEDIQAFKEKGTLNRQNTINNLPPVKTGAIGDAAKLDPRMVKVQGERSTQPEFDWREAAHAATTHANVGISADFSHHEALSNHIEELNQRLPAGAKNIPVTVRGSSTAHLPDVWFNQHQNLFSNGTQLQESQFKPKDRSLLEARRSLARSAKAQSLGMKEAAVSHFRQAVDHFSTAAQHLHAQNVARGANVGEAPVEDWDKGDRVLTAYRKSIGA